MMNSNIPTIRDEDDADNNWSNTNNSNTALLPFLEFETNTASSAAAEKQFWDWEQQHNNSTNTTTTSYHDHPNSITTTTTINTNNNRSINSFDFIHPTSSYMYDFSTSSTSSHGHDSNLHQYSQSTFASTNSNFIIPAAAASSHNTQFPEYSSLNFPKAETYFTTNDEFNNYTHHHDHIGSSIGLNLGRRTYFSSREFSMMKDSRLLFRRGKSGGSFYHHHQYGSSSSINVARCQAEGCKIDLSNAKHYHRRHKVCEFHSKATKVVSGGLEQRFCQQCSRFHVLAEFDESKRSCRKRLADHNRRRRKQQPQPVGPTDSLLLLPPDPDPDPDASQTSETNATKDSKVKEAAYNLLCSSGGAEASMSLSCSKENLLKVPSKCNNINYQAASTNTTSAMYKQEEDYEQYYSTETLATTHHLSTAGATGPPAASPTLSLGGGIKQTVVVQQEHQYFTTTSSRQIHYQPFISNVSNDHNYPSSINLSHRDANMSSTGGSSLPSSLRHPHHIVDHNLFFSNVHSSSSSYDHEAALQLASSTSRGSSSSGHQLQLR